jgi:hypothetical protein
MNSVLGTQNQGNIGPLLNVPGYPTSGIGTLVRHCGTAQSGAPRSRIAGYPRCETALICPRNCRIL